MTERATQRPAAWETLIGLVGLLTATQVAGDSMLDTIAASALFTVGVAASAHAGAMIVKGLHRTSRPRRRSDDKPRL
jgi:hypothetical protein